MEKAKEKLHEFFKSTKTSLKSILKHPEINMKKINDVVIVLEIGNNDNK
jgi:hypothetical protein